MLKKLFAKIRDLFAIKLICHECKRDVAKEEHGEKCLSGLLKQALARKFAESEFQALEGEKKKA